MYMFMEMGIRGAKYSIKNNWTICNIYIYIYFIGGVSSIMNRHAEATENVSLTYLDMNNLVNIFTKTCTKYIYIFIYKIKLALNIKMLNMYIYLSMDTR